MSTKEESEKLRLLKAQTAEKERLNNESTKENDFLKDHASELEKIVQQYTGKNQLLQDNKQAQQNITDQLKEHLKVVSENKSEVKETLNLSKRVVSAIQSSIGPYSSIKKIQSEIGKNLKINKDIEQQIAQIVDSEVGSKKELVEEAKKRLIFDSKTKSLGEEIKANAEQQLNAIANLNAIKKTGNATEIEDYQKIADSLKLNGTILKEEESLHNKNSTAASKIETSQAQQLVALTRSKENLEASNKELAIHLERREAINNATGLTGKLLTGINKALGGALGDSSSLLKNAEERIELINKENERFDEQGEIVFNNVGKLRGFGIVLGEIGKGIADNITDPLVLIGAILAFSDQTTELQRNLSLTEDQAENLKDTFRETSVAIGDAAINSLTIQKAALGINESLGDFAFTFDSPDMQQMVGEAAKFQEKMKGSAKEMTGIVQSSLITGKSFEELQEEILGVTNELEKQTGVKLNEAKIMKEAASVTGEIRAQLGGSVVEITKAIATAKSFGMELKDIAGTADSLLNFEQSIGAELEAELLTGKQLNLEKARLAALTGDYKTLAEEINKNVGDFNDFSNMNVLQQRAQAAALGMTSDQLADILLKEGNIEELKEKARLSGDKETLDMLEKRTLSEDFADAIEKVKQVFVDIVGGPGGELLKIVAGLAKAIANFAETGIGGIIVKVLILAKLLGGPIMKAWRAYQTISTFIKANTLAIGASERMNLITKRQAVILRTKEDLLQKQSILNSRTKRIYENQSLAIMIKRNLQRKLAIAQEKISLGIEKSKGFFAEKTLFTRVKEGVVKTGTYLKDKVSLGIDTAKAGIQNLINNRLVTQGLLTVKNIAKKGIELAVTAAIAVASAAKGAFLALGGIAVIGPALAIAAALGAAALIYKIAKPKKTGDFMSKGQNIGESITPGSLKGNEGMVSVGGKTRTFDTNVDEVNISPNAVTGVTPKQIPVKTSAITQQVTSAQQDNSDIVKAIKALGEKPGMMEQSTDTLPAPTDLFAENTKMGKGAYQRQNKGQVLFT